MMRREPSTAYAYLRLHATGTPVKNRLNRTTKDLFPWAKYNGVVTPPWASHESLREQDAG